MVLPTTMIIFIITLAFASLPPASPFYILNYTRFSCDGNTTDLSSGNSEYPTNNGLDTLLSHLGSLSTGFTNYTYTFGSGSVYGLALCRGDVPSSNCTNCVASAVATLRANCTSKIEAIVWREWCTVRYSDRYIFSTLEEDPNFTLRNINDITGTDWSTALDETLSNVTAKAAAGGSKKFATGETAFVSRNIYAMAECTPDLSEADCKECFRVAKGLLNVTREGSIALLPSCTLRFEMYPFYYSTGTETYSMVPLPSPSPAPEYSNLAALEDQNKRASYSKSVEATLALVALVILLLISMMVIYLHRRNKKISAPARGLSFDVSSMSPIEYKLRTLEDATQVFSKDNEIGRGGFGAVYKGKLRNGAEIAVKKLNKRGEEFKNEVVSLAKVQHRNLVRLLGYCLTPEGSFLVYEFVPNHNLCHFLFDPTMREQLDWPKRFTIIKGIANGMQYLHEGSRTTIIHRDLKPSNILLDTKMHPKIGDFGLARIYAGRSDPSDSGEYCRGYMAPEYFSQYQYSMRSDVYSFGVIVLEIVTGKLINKFPQTGSTTDLLSYAWENWTKGTPMALLDSTLTDISHFSDQVIRCIEIGLSCIQDKDKRPPMSKIVRLLDPSTPNNLPSLQPPQFFLCAMSNQQRTGLESDQAANPRTQISVNGVTITKLEPR